MEIHWGIRKKLVLIFTLCALIFVLVSAPIISYLSYDAYKSNADLQQGRLVGAVRISAAIAAYVKNEEIANEVLSGLLQDDEILAVEISGIEGFSLSAQSNQIAPATLSKRHVTDYPLYSPVDSGKQIGDIKVWSNDLLISERAKDRVESDILWLISLSFLLSIASIFGATILVGSPLKKLALQLAQAQPGSNDRVVVSSIHRHDEIGLVADNVNNFIRVTNRALETERELRHQIEKLNQHYQNIFSSSHVGIMVLDENGVLLHHNPVLLERIVQLNESQLKQATSGDFFSLIFKEPEKAWKLVDAARQTHETQNDDLELTAAWKSPCWVHCLLTINRDEQTSDEIIEAVLYDVTSRIQETAIAKQQAEEDPLTGLKNRRGCERYIRQRLKRKGGHDNLFAMALDLDGFKPVNDSYGHATGDNVLVEIASRLRNSLRSPSDVVGRLGGDEFVIFLEIQSANKDHVAKIAHNIIEQVAKPIQIPGLPMISIGVSIGIAYAANFEDFDSLLQAADRAMYQVKSSGKNSFRFADEQGPHS